MTADNSSGYDVIVVGARCAGASTAMLLARAGHRVLIVDRAHFPSDTVSTHLIHPPGVALLQQWGLLGRLVATGCPPITTYCFDFGPVDLHGRPRTSDGAATAYCPRRTVLDKLLVDAAAEAGAEVQQGFSVQELLFQGDRVVGVRGRTSEGAIETERAAVVVGADGAHSRVADAVGADRYHHTPMLAVAYYSYWSGFPIDDARWAVRPGRGYGAFPTHDGLTMVLAAWPHSEFGTVKQDVDGNYLDAVRQVYGDQLTGARLEERVVGGGAANHFRTPYGPGWALVGDAGYLKDPVTAQGITDAFQDAETCAEAIHCYLRGERVYNEAMADYRQRRDARARPMYEFTAQLASLEPPPPELQEMLAAIDGNQEAMDEFADMFAGTVSPVEFFDPAHMGQLGGNPRD